MYFNNDRRKGNKGFANALGSTILIIVAFGVVIILISGGLKNNWTAFLNIFSKYGPPDVNDSTAFLYSIDDFSLTDPAASGCTADSRYDRTYRCSAGKYVDFTVDIKNGGTRLRKISGGIMVCDAKCRNGVCQPLKDCDQNFDAKGEACYVADGQILECEAGSFEFKSGEYVVYPVATCEFNQAVGCYSPEMLEADRIVDSKNYLNIIVS